jgi:hypothetical protein
MSSLFVSRFSAKEVGTSPMMTSMINPMLFCPSFVPYAKQSG